MASPRAAFFHFKDRPELGVKWGHGIFQSGRPSRLDNGQRTMLAVSGCKRSASDCGAWGMGTKRLCRSREMTAREFWRIASAARNQQSRFPERKDGSGASRIERGSQSGVRVRLGLNFGPTRDTQSERGRRGLRIADRRLRTICGIRPVTASPNTPGLRQLAVDREDAEIFDAMAERGGETAHAVPLLLKSPGTWNATISCEFCDTRSADAGMESSHANSTIARERRNLRAAPGWTQRDSPSKIRDARGPRHL